MSPHLEEVISSVAKRLQVAGFDSPRLEARILLGHLLQCDANQVLFSSAELTIAQKQELESMLAQRLAHQPLDKIVGHKDFYKNSFVVSNDVLSPRPDTELIVEAAIAYAQVSSAKKMLDLGVGSGCILLSILDDINNLRGVGLEQSTSALKVASTNAQNLQLSSRVELVEGSWFDGNIAERLGADFDFITANPPYIPSADITELAPEVKHFDPLSALDGGVDGLRDYRAIANLAPRLLKSGGHVFLEVGIHQAQDVVKIFQDCGFELIDIMQDLNSIERCVILKK